MDSTTLTVILFFVGIPITWYITRYYYVKTKKKYNFKIFLRYATSFFDNIETPIKEKLTFDGSPVIELAKLRFLIANTGNVSITNVIHPLKMCYPHDSEIISYYIYDPYGRIVKEAFNDDDNFMIFNFDLLNPGEYFEIEILIQINADDVDESPSILKAMVNYNFSITTPNIPNKLIVEDYISEKENGKEEALLLLLNIISALIYGFVIYRLGIKLSDYNLFEFNNFFSSFNVDKFFIILSWLLLLFSAVMTSIALIMFLVNRNKKIYIKLINNASH